MTPVAEGSSHFCARHQVLLERPWGSFRAEDGSPLFPGIDVLSAKASSHIVWLQPGGHGAR